VNLCVYQSLARYSACFVCVNLEFDYTIDCLLWTFWKCVSLDWFDVV
jgi:hypothetical protein